MKKASFYLLVFLFLAIAGAGFSQQNIFEVIPPEDNLPEDFIEINVDVLDPPTAVGYVFFSVFGAWGMYPDLTPYQIITDNYGTPVYFRKTAHSSQDFKLQPNGYITFYGGNSYKHHMMDSSYNIVKEFQVINHSTDFHDCQILENGNYLLLGHDDRIVDMDTVVQGGHPGVTVRGALIQIISPQEEILFEWSSWDHYRITDAADYQVDFTDPNFIDYVHANALEMDTDSTILICCRNMDEVTKISSISGEIIWRLGGKKNQFTYAGEDTMGFYMQHDIRRLPDGLYQIFDNGNQHDPPFSNALQLSLDVENKIATVVRRIRSNPDISGWIMGNAQHLPNGHTFVGWGSGIPNITEFKADGSKALQFSFEAMTYRAFRFPWETKAFEFDRDTMHFGEINSGDSLATPLRITNNLQDSIVINHIVSRTGKFDATGTFPLEIAPGGEKELSIQFKPEEEGIFDDVLTICHDINTEEQVQRIAKQIPVKAAASEDLGIDPSILRYFSFYPNPVSDHLNIRLDKLNQSFEILLYNPGGELLDTYRLKKGEIRINMENYPAGIYLLMIRSEENPGRFIHKLIKQ